MEKKSSSGWYWSGYLLFLGMWFGEFLANPATEPTAALIYGGFVLALGSWLGVGFAITAMLYQILEAL